MVDLIMKIRILLTTTFALISSYSAANSNFNGPYVGIGLGANHESFKSSDNLLIDIPLIPLTITINTKSNGSAKSLSGNLNAGYSSLISSNTYLAFEARVNAGSMKNKMSMDTAAVAGGVSATQFNLYHTVKKSSPSFVAALKPGVLLTPKSSFYGVIGTEVARFKLTSQAGYMQSSGFTYEATASGAKTSTKCGLLAGAGINSYIQNNVSIGLEYNYVD